MTDDRYDAEDVGETADPRLDHIFEAAEKIVEDVSAELQNGSRVRLFFPGGPLDIIGIEGIGEWTLLILQGETYVTLHTRSIVGWQLLD